MIENLFSVFLQQTNIVDCKQLKSLIEKSENKSID